MKFKTALPLSLSLLLICSSSIFAIEYGGIGGRPAYPNEENPRTESIFIYEDDPGSVLEDGIVVVNNTSETKTILVYATDTTPSSGGGFACKQYAEEVINEGTWFDLNKDEVTLEAGTNEIVPFTVTIPENAEAGEHNACIVIQEKKDDSSEAGINLNVRTAIRAMITIPGDIIRNLGISSFSYVKSDNGKNLLNVVLINSGNVSIDADIDVEINNFVTSKLFGSNRGTYSILKDTTQEFNFDLDSNPWGGIYKATLGVTYEGDTGEEVLADNFVFIIIPTVYVIGLYAVILVVFITTIVLLINSSKKRKLAIKSAVEYFVKDGDTLNTLAKERNMSWRLLAKINNLKAPYSIKSGDKLMAPPVKVIQNVNPVTVNKESVLPSQSISPNVVMSTTQSVGSINSTGGDNGQNTTQV